MAANVVRGSIIINVNLREQDVGRVTLIATGLVTSFLVKKQVKMC